MNQFNRLDLAVTRERVKQVKALKNHRALHLLLELPLQFDLVGNECESSYEQCLKRIFRAIGVFSRFEKLLALFHELQWVR